MPQGFLRMCFLVSKLLIRQLSACKRCFKLVQWYLLLVALIISSLVKARDHSLLLWALGELKATA